MAKFESKPEPKNSGETLPEQKPRELMLRLRQALESKEGADTLRKLGDLMYETFKVEQYTPEMVLSSLKEVYDEKQNKFQPKLSFNSFIQSFGSNLVKLCQEKLVTQGGFDLGKFGEKKNGVDGKLGKMTSAALTRYYGEKPKAKGKDSTLAQSPKIRSASPSAPPTGASVAPLENPTEEIHAPKLPERYRQQSKQPPVAPANPIAQASYSPQPPKSQDAPPAPIVPAAYYPEAPAAPIASTIPETSEDVQILPYQPGGNEIGHRMSLGKMRQQLNEIYARNDTTLNHKNLPKLYGRSEEEVKRFITLNDPILGGPISFLGKPINYTSQKSGPGVNLIMIPFLKIAEEEIRRSGINYQPKSPISGFKYRTMKLNGKQSNVMSHHGYGLAIDVDPAANDKGMDRGNIPDEVILAMAKVGFAWGSAGNAAFSYLGDDPMHFQLRFDAREPEAQRIIQSSPIGRKYWQAILPLLPADYKKGLGSGGMVA